MSLKIAGISMIMLLYLTTLLSFQPTCFSSAGVDPGFVKGDGSHNQNIFI